MPKSAKVSGSSSAVSPLPYKRDTTVLGVFCGSAAPLYPGPKTWYGVIFSAANHWRNRIPYMSSDAQLYHKHSSRFSLAFCCEEWFGTCLRTHVHSFRCLWYRFEE